MVYSVKCVTPSFAVCPTSKINRLKNLPSAESMGNIRQITFKTSDGLQPVFTNDEPAPKSILENISCGCLKNCGSACGCRKQGMKFSVACKACYGESCSNSRIEIQPDDQFSDSDSDHEDVTTTKRKKSKYN